MKVKYEFQIPDSDVVLEKNDVLVVRSKSEANLGFSAPYLKVVIGELLIASDVTRIKVNTFHSLQFLAREFGLDGIKKANKFAQMFVVKNPDVLEMVVDGDEEEMADFFTSHSNDDGANLLNQMLNKLFDELGLGDEEEPFGGRFYLGSVHSEVGNKKISIMLQARDLDSAKKEADLIVSQFMKENEDYEGSAQEEKDMDSGKSTMSKAFPGQALGSSGEEIILVLPSRKELFWTGPGEWEES